jgi:hypothetical protein
MDIFIGFVNFERQRYLIFPIFRPNKSSKGAAKMKAFPDGAEKASLTKLMI